MHDIWGAPPPERKTDIAALDEKVLARALDTLILAVERHQPMSIESLLRAGVPTTASVRGVNAFEHLLTLAEASAEQHPEVLRALLAHAPQDAQVRAAEHVLRQVRESQPDAAVSRRQRAAAEQRLRTLLDAGAPSMAVLQEDMALGSSVLNQVSPRARARENRKPRTRAPLAHSERVCASLSANL